MFVTNHLTLDTNVLDMEASLIFQQLCSVMVCVCLLCVNVVVIISNCALLMMGTKKQQGC